MSRAAPLAAAMLAARVALAQSPAPPFTVTDTSVRQGRFEAVARSRDEIVSSYPRAAQELHFKFSLGGTENEFPPGTDHTIWLRPRDGRIETPPYAFGVEGSPAPPSPDSAAMGEDGPAQVTIRLDLRAVQRALRDSGVYVTPTGDRITGELPPVYVVGDVAPLTWEFSSLKPGSPLQLTDADGEGIFTVTLTFATHYTRPRTADGRAVWRRQVDVGSFPAPGMQPFPTVESSQRLQDALYRMALEELIQLWREDGALSAGAKWPGVWTRDVSLSAILSLALIAPDATRTSLMAKVDSSGRIIQDTGTGGSWPVSTDRMVWALAAWELYAATGDRDWLRQAYDIIRRSAEADLHAVHDARTGLFRGESSFMDWREQSYPRWMQPADIYRSENLGTNAIHHGAYRALARMARALGEPGARWDSIADGIARGMTAELWQDSLGWFSEYRYGRVHLSRSPRAEMLGESLASIYGAARAGQRRTMSARAPLVAFGAPVFWPYIPGERFYHNAAIWPFVTAYWTWASAEGGNTQAVQRGLDANARAAALFLTNKENIVAATGHFEGTALNSDAQLWSVAGMLAGTYRILLGIRLEPERMAFRPMVPPSYGGERTVRGIRYREATLTVTVRGHGDGVSRATLDGAPLPDAAVPATLAGAHSVVLEMNHRWPDTGVNVVESRFAPATPHARMAGGRLVWDSVPSAVSYVAYRNGRPSSRTTDTSIALPSPRDLDEWQTLAVNAEGDESFLSEPVRAVSAMAEQRVKPAGGTVEREEAGFTGAGYLRLTRTANTRVRATVTVTRAGLYAIDVRYANGNGPVNTEDKVAVRTVTVDDDTAGVIVMPQRGSGRWSEWGWSNPLVVHLAAGAHAIHISYQPLDANMNRAENTALLDVVRVTRLGRDSSTQGRTP